MSLRKKKKRKEDGIFLFPEERTFGSPSTNKIRVAGKVQEGEVVRPQPPTPPPQAK